MELRFSGEHLGKETIYGSLDGYDLMVLAFMKGERASVSVLTSTYFLGTEETQRSLQRLKECRLVQQRGIMWEPTETDGTDTKVPNKELDEKKRLLINLLNRVTRRSFRSLPQRGITSLLKNYTLEEIETALREMMNDSWHGPKMKELKLDYILRETTIDTFYQRGSANAARYQSNPEPLVTL